MKAGNMHSANGSAASCSDAGFTAVDDVSDLAKTETSSGSKRETADCEGVCYRVRQMDVVAKLLASVAAALLMMQVIGQHSPSQRSLQQSDLSYGRDDAKRVHRVHESQTVSGLAALALKSNLEKLQNDVQLSQFKRALASLEVPNFYVYDTVAWRNATLDGEPLFDAREAVPYIRTNRKHSDDLFFAQAAYTHPRRVDDPAKAELFVVPALLNLILQMDWDATRSKGTSRIPTLCVENTCCTAGQRPCKLLVQTNRMLQDSEWFQRHKGVDHILVYSHWYAIPPWQKLHKKILLEEGYLDKLYGCSKIVFENHGNSEHLLLEHSTPGARVMNLPTLYVAGSDVIECAPSLSAIKTKTFTFVGSVCPYGQRASSHQMQLECVPRTNLCEWLYESSYAASSTCGGRKSLPEHHWSKCDSTNRVKCEGLTQCEGVAETKYGFHMHGDTPTSNRLVDYLVSGVIPVVSRAHKEDTPSNLSPIRQ
jgi:hypothetical protein